MMAKFCFDNPVASRYFLMGFFGGFLFFCMFCLFSLRNVVSFYRMFLIIGKK